MDLGLLQKVYTYVIILFKIECKAMIAMQRYVVRVSRSWAHWFQFFRFLQISSDARWA